MTKSYEKIIDSGTKLLVEVLQYQMPFIQKDIINQIMFNYDMLNEDEKYLATTGVMPTTRLAMETTL